MSGEHPHPYGLLNLGKCYLFGWGVDQDTKRAQELIGLLASKKETTSAEAQFLFGYCFELNKDSGKAIKWYHRAQRDGHLEAQYRLGVVYVQSGKNEVGVKLVEDAAAKGFFEADFMLGFWCHEQNNFDKAIIHLRKALGAGHEQAQELLLKSEKSKQAQDLTRSMIARSAFTPYQKYKSSFAKRQRKEDKKTQEESKSQSLDDVHVGAGNGRTATAKS